MTNGPQEPTARAAARELWDLFKTLTAEGFTKTQALKVIGQVIAAHKPPTDV